MPIKDPEKRRAYDRERKRKKRAREKQAELEQQWKRGNINFGPRAKAEQFMTFEEFKRQNPRASFRDYLDKKMNFQRENRVEPIRKISKDKAIEIRGFDMWHGHERKEEEIRQHHKEADALEELLRQPAHSTEPKERYDWKKDLEDAIEQINKNMKSEKEDEKSED